MKKFHIAVIAVILLAGCAPKDMNISIDAIKESITKEIKLENPQVTDLGGNREVAERFGLPLDKIQEGFVYTNDESGKSADEIVVIKAKDAKSVSEIERALEAEITGLANAWEGTDKAEYEKVQKHILRSKGKYVMLAVGEEGQKAIDIFNGFFG